MNCWRWSFFWWNFSTKKTTTNHKPTPTPGSNRSDALGFVGSGGGALVAAGPILAVLVGRSGRLVARSTSFGGSALFLGCQNATEAGQQSKLSWTKRCSFLVFYRCCVWKVFVFFVALFVYSYYLTSCSCSFFLFSPQVFVQMFHVVDMAKWTDFHPELILSCFSSIIGSTWVFLQLGDKRMWRHLEEPSGHCCWAESWETWRDLLLLQRFEFWRHKLWRRTTKKLQESYQKFVCFSFISLWTYNRLIITNLEV